MFFLDKKIGNEYFLSDHKLISIQFKRKLYREGLKKGNNIYLIFTRKFYGSHTGKDPILVLKFSNYFLF